MRRRARRSHNSGAPMAHSKLARREMLTGRTAQGQCSQSGNEVQRRVAAPIEYDVSDRRPVVPSRYGVFNSYLTIPREVMIRYVMECP